VLALVWHIDMNRAALKMGAALDGQSLVLNIAYDMCLRL
jgi:hypothetical protein